MLETPFWSAKGEVIILVCLAGVAEGADFVCIPAQHGKVLQKSLLKHENLASGGVSRELCDFTYSFTGAPGSNALPHSTTEIPARNKAATALIMVLLRSLCHQC